MNVDEAGLRRIIREEVDASLDMKLVKHLNEFEAKFDKKFVKLKEDLDYKFELKATEFFGQWSCYLDDRFSEFEQRLEPRLQAIDDNIQGILDRLDTDEVERAAMYVQLDRHDGWIHQLAKRARVKLI